MLRNNKGKVLHMFSKHVVITDYNEAEVLAILEAFHNTLVVESDFANAISWVKSFGGPWKCIFYSMRFVIWCPFSGFRFSIFVDRQIGLLIVLLSNGLIMCLT